MEESYAHCAIASSVLRTGVLWLDNGVFYARLPLQGEPQPITVALHGVSDQSHATQAYCALLPLTEPANRLIRPEKKREV